MSSTFLNFFKLFFKAVCQALFRATAFIYYHLFKLLSITFFRDFLKSFVISFAQSDSLTNISFFERNVNTFFIKIYAKIAMANVPTVIAVKPANVFLVNFSFKKIYEKATVINMLILSIGTTTLTIPFWIA